ncbi:MAG: hypothetical protein PHU12_01130 [Candidatus Aenigmarchaeota archaeon]|nr:hypothetical protein [Candidatus Aenigmarchaeota archaeon]
MASITKDFHDVKKGDSVLLLANSKNYASDNVNVVKHFSSKRYKGIYVTVNRPYENIRAMLKQKNVNMDSMYFIDMISRKSNLEATDERCIYVNSPESLTGTGIALEQIAKTVRGDKFIYLDSLSTLLTYNPKQTVLKFAHFLATKTREWNVVGIVISLKNQTDKNMLSQLTQFFDKVIEEK